MYTGDGRRSLRISRFLYFIERQRYLDSYLTFSFETIFLDSRSGCCLLCLSQCIFILRESNLLLHFSCLKNTGSWDCVGRLMLSSTWYFTVQLLRYKAISIDPVTVNYLFYEGHGESKDYFLSRLDFPCGVSQALQSSFLFACPREEAVIYLIILKQRIWSKICRAPRLHHSQTFLCIFLCRIKELWRCLLCFQNPPCYAGATHPFLEE